MNPRQWSLAKQSCFKVEMIARRCQNQAEAKRDGAINPQNYNFHQF